MSIKYIIFKLVPKSMLMQINSNLMQINWSFLFLHYKSLRQIRRPSTKSLSRTESCVNCPYARWPWTTKTATSFRTIASVCIRTMRRFVCCASVRPPTAAKWPIRSTFSGPSSTSYPILYSIRRRCKSSTSVWSCFCHANMFLLCPWLCQLNSSGTAKSRIRPELIKRRVAKRHERRLMTKNSLWTIRVRTRIINPLKK